MTGRLRLIGGRDPIRGARRHPRQLDALDGDLAAHLCIPCDLHRREATRAGFRHRAITIEYELFACHVTPSPFELRLLSRSIAKPSPRVPFESEMYRAPRSPYTRSMPTWDMMPLLHGHLLDFLLTVDKNRPICEELVLGNSTLKKMTWANAELYGGNHSHRAFQTHISTVFVHDIGFPRKRGRVGGLPNDDASTHFGGRTRGGRLAGWRAAGLRLAGRLAGDKLAASGERANRGRRQPSRRKTVKRGRPRPTPGAERTTERPIPPYAMV